MVIDKINLQTKKGGDVMTFNYVKFDEMNKIQGTIASALEVLPENHSIDRLVQANELALDILTTHWLPEHFETGSEIKAAVKSSTLNEIKESILANSTMLDSADPTYKELTRTVELIDSL